MGDENVVKRGDASLRHVLRQRRLTASRGHKTLGQNLSYKDGMLGGRDP